LGPSSILISPSYLTALSESIKADHGYANDSPTIRRLIEVMSQFKPTEQREFLKFITGSPRLPVGGLKALNPKLTVVRKTPEFGNTADAYLPSAMTCANYLKLPDYSSKDVMIQKLKLAMTEGQGSFHLS
jgi:E3 ubiquitin-protein ligase TRIP12